ncbi:hypothetical protein MTR67_018908 [Solanum verrucosum]|uniref:Retrotransposon gag domain-containing protein n=1 Tax=Solanum verrucosum TaxID=315347 RepID=A0AAF0TU74_SOLVR|nr:hypothetical protein MTR67_018908 [Solanum verrucosum]
MIVGVTPVEKVELTAYQLNGVAQVWFNQWKGERKVDVGPLDWEKFKVAFLDRFFPFEMREAKVLEFINLDQGNMGVKKYSLNFTQLSRYVLCPNAHASVRGRASIKVTLFKSRVSYPQRLKIKYIQSFQQLQFKASIIKNSRWVNGMIMVSRPLIAYDNWQPNYIVEPG